MRQGIGRQTALARIEIVDDAPDREPVPMLGADDARGQPAQAVEPDRGAHGEIGARDEIERKPPRMRQQRDFRCAAEQRQHRNIFRHVERRTGLLQFGDTRFGVMCFIRRDERGEGAAQAFDTGAIARDGVAKIGIGRHVDEEP